MSRLTRLLILVTVAGAATWSTAPRAAVAVTADDGVFQRAAIALGHEAPAMVSRWLRRQPAVGTARMGPDGRTLTIHFADGRRAVILSPELHASRLPMHADPTRARAATLSWDAEMHGRGEIHRASAASARKTGAMNLASTEQASRTASSQADSGRPARAAAFEPFATELGFSPQGFDPAVSYLKLAGFQVDAVYDSQVTLATMATLGQYNVVYVLSHSGVEDDGTGLLATAQETACKPYTSPDGTVQAVGVWGSSTCYLAITPKFIEKLPDHFPPDSIVFLNGCTLLISHPFWVALANRGAGVMLSWNGDAINQDDAITAQDVFGELQSGLSVASAIDAVRALGAGRSVFQGKIATLGFAGDGGITLKRAAAAVPPAVPPTLIPTDTPVPTKTPTPTSTPTPGPATPTATATPEPSATPTADPPPSLSIPTSAVPGQRVEITVKGAAPGSSAQLLVVYPSSSTVQQTQRADSGGTLRFAYFQQAAQITRGSRTAHVTVQGSGGAFRLAGEYAIGFGPVDVYIQQRHPAPGSMMTIWTHSTRRTIVHLRLRSEGRMLRTTLTQGGRWSKLPYRLPPQVRSGQTVLAAARVASGAGLDLAIARVSVR